MLRKLSLIAVAAASLGAAALAPTSASAWGFHPGWHGGWYHGGPRFYVGGPGYYGYGGCYVRELVPTPWGPRWRLVNRCSERFRRPISPGSRPGLIGLVPDLYEKAIQRTGNKFRARDF